MPAESATWLQAIFANVVPSGQGFVWFVLIAFTAISLPIITRSVPLSSRSVELIATQSLYSGIKAIPFKAGLTPLWIKASRIHLEYCSFQVLVLAVSETVKWISVLRYDLSTLISIVSIFAAGCRKTYCCNGITLNCI